MGQWLRAGVLRQHEVRALVREQLSRTGWHDAASVAEVAFELAVRHAYSPGNIFLPVPDLVEGMREFFGADGVDRIPQAEGETLVRVALGKELSSSRDATQSLVHSSLPDLCRTHARLALLRTRD